VKPLIPILLLICSLSYSQTYIFSAIVETVPLKHGELRTAPHEERVFLAFHQDYILVATSLDTFQLERNQITRYTYTYIDRIKNEEFRVDIVRETNGFCVFIIPTRIATRRYSTIIRTKS
jgi:hypothetical protein